MKKTKYKNKRKGRGKTKKVGIHKFLSNREIGIGRKPQSVGTSIWLKPSYYNKMTARNRANISPRLSQRAAIRRRPKLKRK